VPRAALGAYLDLLAEWSARVNLTGARSAGERVRLLVAPVLPALPHLQGASLLDVGSGNGSPGLVLGLLRPDLELTLLEPRQKRWAFLREAARRAGRPAAIRRERHDQYPGPPATTVSRRAVDLGPAALAHLVAPGGRLLVWGPRPAEDGGWRVETAAPGLHVARRP
jgi:16S rRNA (guanine(527)-N(7))-methyltransferase RsmG